MGKHAAAGRGSGGRLPALAKLFRGKFVAFLEQAYRRDQLELHGELEELRHPVCFEGYLDALRNKGSVVFTKAPFAGPEHVLKYLARYTHRVAISNQRLLRMEDDGI